MAQWSNGYNIGFVTFNRRFSSRIWHCLVISEIGNRLSQVNYLGDNHNQFNSAFYPFWVAKSSTSFGWGKSHCCRVVGNNVWSHLISSRHVVISKNCYILFTLQSYCQNSTHSFCWAILHMIPNSLTINESLS